MDHPQRTLPLHPSILRGLKAVVQLGEDRVKMLAERQANAPLVLSLPPLMKELSQSLSCNEEIIHQAFLEALIPLNGIRRGSGLAPDEFVEALVQSIAQKKPTDWTDSDLEVWSKINPHILVFLQPDNFFSQASKAFELLSQRPAVFKHAKILNELRPIYDESVTKTLALLQTNTIVLNYWHDGEESTIHITLDADDLESLSDELERAKNKVRVNRKEAAEAGTNLLIYGQIKD